MQSMAVDMQSIALEFACYCGLSVLHMLQHALYNIPSETRHMLAVMQMAIPLSATPIKLHPCGHAGRGRCWQIQAYHALS